MAIEAATSETPLSTRRHICEHIYIHGIAFKRTFSLLYVYMWVGTADYRSNEIKYFFSCNNYMKISGNFVPFELYQRVKFRSSLFISHLKTLNFVYIK